jgi:hypothetical protein
MVLTIQQLVESFLIAALLVLATSPHLFSFLLHGQQLLNLLHLF